MSNDQNRIADLTRLIDQGAAEYIPEPPRVAKTVSAGNYPTTAQAFYAVQWHIVGGLEVEGEPAVYTPTDHVFRALNLGTNIPPEGTMVVCHLGGYSNWVFQY